MNKLKSFIPLFILIFSIFIPNISNAIENTGQVYVATADLKNARIISQDNGTLKIAFDIKNEKGLQTGIKYGIQLLKKGTNHIYDEKSYGESLTLYGNSEIKKEITYQAPKNLSGDFQVALSIANESNFIFSYVSVGEIKLSSQSKGVNILNESCTLQVEGENKNYNLSQNVDILNKENLKLTCSAQNESGKDIEVSPYFETKFGGVYGKVAEQSGGDYKTITFKKGEKKNFSVILPKGNVPQFYHLKFALMGKDSSSNNIYVNYIIRGLNATIHKISLDKDYYKAGESGKISLIWSASSGDFSRSGAKYSYPPDVSFKAEIVSDSGRACMDKIEQKLVRDPKIVETVFDFSTKANCKNPKVSASIISSGGKILDQKDFTFTSNPENSKSKPLGTKETAMIVIGLLVIIGVGVYLNKKNSSRATM